MIIPGDFPDLAELKRLADACPPAGNHHFESDEWKAVMAFRDEVVRLFGCDVGMAKALIAESDTLRKDSARYQWLREARRGYIEVVEWIGPHATGMTGEDLDKLLDTAMGRGEPS